MAAKSLTRRITRCYTADPPKDTPYGNLPEIGGQRAIIDKLGLGDTILRMRAKKMTQEQIAVALGLSTPQVRDWLNKYEELDPEEKAQVYQNSIFNVEARLEDIAARMYTLLDDLNSNKSNPELQATILKNLLATTKVACEFIEKVQVYKKNERFKEAMLKVLEDLQPGLRNAVLMKLSELNDSITALRPL